MSIEDVVFETGGQRDVHVDGERGRVVVGLMNEPFEETIESPEQFRVIYVTRRGELGNHWREYGEKYALAAGSAKFLLKDIDTNQRADYTMNRGDRLYIPPRIALKVKAQRGTIIMCAAGSYDAGRLGKEGVKSQTHKYEF